jgi:uncharacterized protein YndB with AHSA1/START domain
VLVKILIGVAGAILILVAVATTRPAEFHIERSVTIAAPPAVVFPRVNDFHAWASWSPWEKLDPNLKRTYSGPAAGAGATYAWVGNSDVGEGKMTIQKSEPSSRVAIQLEFIKPFAATNQATFTFAPLADGTKVTWGMDGQNNFMSKIVSLFMDMDKLVGGDFERGLANLKQQSESTAAAAPTAPPTPPAEAAPSAGAASPAPPSAVPSSAAPSSGAARTAPPSAPPAAAH